MSNPVSSAVTTDEAAREPEQVRAAVIGFARTNCQHCHGRGRIGFDTRYKDNLHVIVCACVEMMDLETVQKSLEEKRAADTSTSAPQN